MDIFFVIDEFTVMTIDYPFQGGIGGGEESV